MSDHLKPHHFKPGESGNPNGRPRLSDEQKQQRKETQAAIKNLAPESMELLQDLLDQHRAGQITLKPMELLQVTRFLVEQSEGKPKQKVEVDDVLERSLELKQKFLSALDDELEAG